MFATAGSAQKCAAVEKLGATAINYREEDFAAVIAAATMRRGVDVVLDMVGAPYTERNLRCLAREWHGWCRWPSCKAARCKISICCR